MILVGGAIIGFAYLSKNFEGILEACQSINGMVGGPTIGFYTIGIFIPFVSELPAMMGLICGLSVSIWVFFGSNKFPAGPEERFSVGEHFSVQCYCQRRIRDIEIVTIREQHRFSVTIWIFFTENT